MKNDQDNTGALSAFLHTADSVDTLVTNSLCCAAAGITAPSSATAEALRPHEKLRGAALADATLNAQERQLAQPVVGYTSELNICSNRSSYACPFRNIQVFLLDRFIKYLCCSCSLLQQLNLVLVRAKRPPFLHHDNRFRQLLLNSENTRNDVVRKWLGQGIPKYPATFCKPSSAVFFCRHWIPLFRTTVKRTNSLIRSALSQVSSTSLTLLRGLSSGLYLSTVCVVCHHKRRHDSRYRTESLNPSSGVICRPLSKQQNRYSADKKSSWWRKCNFQQDISSEANFLRKHLWLLAIIQFVIVNKSRNIVHGGVA